ncbi:MAG TPA: hypothetical protein VLE22_03675 [Bryobacteraceae bacterium]|nr:hypothetical protein [Bryobacteraceae bacterium]
MIQTFMKSWWLLALCGVLDAIISVVNLLMQDPDGALTLRTFAVKSTAVFLGKVALAAGVCTVAAGIWNSRKGKSWLLVLNGLALSAFGLLCFWTDRRLDFRTFALLLVVMAVSFGIFALATALTLRHQVPDKWFLSLAGAASVGFALAFLALGFRWIELVQPESLFLWLSSYFAFSAICMLGLGLISLRGATHRMAGSALPTG